MDAETNEMIRSLVAEGKQEQAAALAQMAAGNPDSKAYRLAREARRHARCCGKCGAAIGPQEPVWIGTIQHYAAMGLGTTETVLCEKCKKSGWRVKYYPIPLRCETCKRPFYRRITRRRTPRYAVCSDACREAAVRAAYFRRKGSREATCPVCGELFTQKRSDAVTCSPACRQKAYRQRVTDVKTASTSDL